MEYSNSNLDIKQEVAALKISLILDFATSININKTHIVFYKINAHIDEVELSIRNKDDYNIEILTMVSNYRIRNNDVAHNNAITKNIDDMLNALHVIDNNPDIQSKSDMEAVLKL